MHSVDLSIVLPCLNEEQTIGLCIEEIREGLRQYERQE